MARSSTKTTTKKKTSSRTPSKTSFLTAWVKKHPNGWNHDDWLDLLSQLDQKQIAYVADEVGVYIEEKRRKLFGW